MRSRPIEVLVVEDDGDTRRFIAELLQSRGYEVSTAGNGLEALAYASVGDFDVIVTDYRMPEMDGLALLNSLRTRCVRATTIVVSAYADVNTCIEAFHHGAVAHLKKPFKTQELVDAVERARPLERS